MNEVHKRFRNIIAENARELTNVEGIFGFIGDIDNDSQAIPASGAAMMTTEDVKKDCKRMCAELE
ncbi:hypothetical protein SEUCBS139899_003054 [Sporothrix eucalyptigena]